jgi:hypothetical protein
MTLNIAHILCYKQDVWSNDEQNHAQHFHVFTSWSWTVIIYYGMTYFVKWKVWKLAIVWMLTVLFCKSPDRLWGPHSLLFGGHTVSFRGGKAARATFLLLVPGWVMSGAVPQLSHTLSWRGQEQLFSYLNVVRPLPLLTSHSQYTW